MSRKAKQCPDQPRPQRWTPAKERQALRVVERLLEAHVKAAERIARAILLG